MTPNYCHQTHTNIYNIQSNKLYPIVSMTEATDYKKPKTSKTNRITKSIKNNNIINTNNSPLLTNIPVRNIIIVKKYIILN